MKPTGKEKHFREMIKGQERKIEQARKRIEEIEIELAVYLDSLPVKSEPFAMAPKDNHDYCGKILYASEKAAHAARKLINRDLKKKGKELMRRAYLCDKCEAWHLTTVPHWMPYPENVLPLSSS